jgi:aldehyde dehydrogenase (NAD+)
MLDRAVAAAKRAFESDSDTTLGERPALLRRVLDAYKSKMDQMAESIFTRDGRSHLTFAKGTCWSERPHHILELADEPDRDEGGARTRGGVPMVLKPSKMDPISACLFAQILHEAAVPPAVFNLVNGDGTTVGSAIASHPNVAMVSFTGSTRAGVAVAVAGAATVKRVTKKLGGKSADILLDEADFEKAVPQGVQECFRNAGQSWNAPIRMLVPRSRMTEVLVAARLSAEATKVADPFTDGISIGPLASQTQFEKVQRLINAGIEEGATWSLAGPVDRIVLQRLLRETHRVCRRPE